MVSSDERRRASEEWARNFERHARATRVTRRLMRGLPRAPRCKICLAPFEGAGGRMVRLVGRRPSRKNPNLCDVCVERGPPGGFETDGGVLFADLRGFTAYAESLSPSEIAESMERFYAAATRVLVDHDAIVDKLVGDEVMALFWPALMDKDPRATMVQAGEALIRAVGYGSEGEPWLPLGVGLDFGHLHMGNLGPPGMRDFTALGDVVNTAARLEAAAGPGQLVLSERVYEGLPDPPPGSPIELELKGKKEPVRAYVVDVGAGV